MRRVQRTPARSFSEPAQRRRTGSAGGDGRSLQSGLRGYDAAFGAVRGRRGSGGALWDARLTASIAAGSALTEWMAGKCRSELTGLRAEVLEEALGGLGAESRHAAVLCCDAVKALLRRLP